MIGWSKKGLVMDSRAFMKTIINSPILTNSHQKTAKSGY